jgi:hypothetical protein
MQVFNSTSEMFKNHLSQLKEISDVNRVLRELAIDGALAVAKRVQNDGQKADNSQIGEYSTKTLSFTKITGKFGSIANKKQLNKRMKAFGDTSEFYGGYKEFRQSLGRQVEFIDLTLTGAMFEDWIPSPLDDNSWGVGFKTSDSAKIAGFHEDRFGIIFALSKDEEKQAIETLTRIINQILK